jgi:hypothetical protein
MDSEKTIHAVYKEDYWLSEEEQAVILAYRDADENIRKAIDRILEVEE